MSIKEIRYPDVSSATDEQELLDQIQNWILQNAESLTIEEAISPMTGELFVPYRYTYQDILRTWLSTHASAQKENNNEAMLLIEKIIECTITQEEKTGTLSHEST